MQSRQAKTFRYSAGEHVQPTASSPTAPADLLAGELRTGAERGPIIASIARWMLARRLRAIVRNGSLRVRGPGEVVLDLGDGSGPDLRVAVTDPLWCARIALNPALALGEAYMEGGLVLERGQLHQLTDLIGRNARRPRATWAAGLNGWWRDRRSQANARKASRRNEIGRA